MTGHEVHINYKRTTYEWNENSIHPPKVSINPCIFVTCFLNKPRELFHESEFFQIQFLLPFNKRQSVQGKRIHTLGQNILRQINGRNSHQCTTNLIGLNKYIFISGIRIPLPDLSRKAQCYWSLYGACPQDNRSFHSLW